MKSTFLQIGIQREFPQLVEDLIHRLDMAFSFVLNVNEDIIQIHNNQDIKFFLKNHIDIALKCYQSIGQSKKHYLIFKVTVSSLKSCFSLISFANSHPIISTDEIKLGKLLGSPQLI